MPRIPDIGDLGQRRVPRTAGGIVSNHSGEIVSAAIADLGDTIQGIQDRRQQAEGQLEYSRAKAAVLKADSEMMSAIDQNPDWSTHDKFYSDGMSKIRDSASQMISDKNAREQFLIDTDATVARGREAVRRNARNLEVRQGRQETINDGQALLDGALSAPDDRIRGEYLAAISNRFDSAVPLGYMQQGEADVYKKKIGETYATGRLDGLPLRERVNMLEHYQGTPAALLPEPERIQRLSIESERLKAEDERLKRQREQDARIAQMDAREALNEQSADAFAMRSTGNTDAKLPPRSLYVAAYGQDGAKRYEQHQRLFTVYDTVATAVALPEAEGRKMIDAYRPQQQEGASDQLKAWGEARQLYDRQRKAIQDDPAAFVVMNDKQTGALFQETMSGTGGPGAAAQYVQRVRSRAAAMGVAPRILPKQDAAQIAATLRFDPEKPKQRVANLQSLAETWGKNYPQVINELAPKMEGDARIIANMEFEDAARYDQALAQGPKTVENALSDTQKSTLNSKVDAAIQPYVETVYASPDGEARADDVRSAVKLLASSMVNRKAGIDDAVTQATAMVLNTKRTAYVGTLQIPTDFNADAVQAGADAVKAGLSPKDLFVIPTEFGDKETAQRDFHDLVKREGTWFTTPDGTGAELRFPTAGGRMLPVKEIVQVKTPAGMVQREVPIRRTWGELEQPVSGPAAADNPHWSTWWAH